MADNNNLSFRSPNKIDSTSAMDVETVLDLTDSDSEASTNPLLEAIKAKILEFEEKHEKLKQLQDRLRKQMDVADPSSSFDTSLEKKIEADNRSIYVGNVEYSATKALLEGHFIECGRIKRITIGDHKHHGHPKGFAYIEFCNEESVDAAMKLDESLFRGRQIKVLPKRTNRPGLSTTNRPPRGKRSFCGVRGVARGMRGIAGGSFRGMRGMSRGSFHGIRGMTRCSFRGIRGMTRGSFRGMRGMTSGYQ